MIMLAITYWFLMDSFVIDIYMVIAAFLSFISWNIKIVSAVLQTIDLIHDLCIYCITWGNTLFWLSYISNICIDESFQYNIIFMSLKWFLNMLCPLTVSFFFAHMHTLVAEGVKCQSAQIFLALMGWIHGSNTEDLSKRPCTFFCK